MPICTTHSRSVGAWTAMFSEALHMRPSWELRQSIWLTFISIYRYLSRSKKKRFHSTVSYAIWFYCFTLFLPFQQTIANVVITPWPWCPTCNFNMSQLQRMPKISPLFPVATAGQVEMHFADIPTLATVLLSHRNTVHPLTEHDNICLEFEFQIRKGKPEIMPLRVVDLRNIDYGWLWYEEICSAYLLLGQSYILPTSGCNLSHSRKNFQIRWKKNWPEFSNVASKFYVCWCHERAQRKHLRTVTHCDKKF